MGRTASTTTITWETWIPQRRIDAPRTGCQYGSGYQFGGDNHTAFDWRDSRFRTVLNAVVHWDTLAVDGYTGIRASHVYRKSTGRLVAKKTASMKDMSVRKLGSGSGWVYIRFVMHASNPFCSVGAIDGAMTLKINHAGAWAIQSGTLRKMPNHYIYVYNGGTVTPLVKVRYQSALCLIGPLACDSVDLTGRYGRYS